MATIALTGNTIGCSLGIGSFESLGKAFLNSKNSTGGLSGALGSLKNKIDIASIAVKADTSQQQVKQAGSRETEKKGALTLAYDKLDTLVSDVGVVDCLVSGKVNRRKDDFYKRYSYLKPECEKSNKEKLADFGRSVWNGICSVRKAICNCLMNIAEWCKEHWVAILTAIVVIVIAVVAAVFLGPAAIIAICSAIAFFCTAGDLIATLITGKDIYTLLKDSGHPILAEMFAGLEWGATIAAVALSFVELGTQIAKVGLKNFLTGGEKGLLNIAKYHLKNLANGIKADFKSIFGKGLKTGERLKAAWNIIVFNQSGDFSLRESIASYRASQEGISLFRAKKVGSKSENVEWIGDQLVAKEGSDLRNWIDVNYPNDNGVIHTANRGGYIDFDYDHYNFQKVGEADFMDIYRGNNSKMFDQNGSLILKEGQKRDLLWNNAGLGKTNNMTHHELYQIHGGKVEIYDLPTIFHGSIGHNGGTKSITEIWKQLGTGTLFMSERNTVRRTVFDLILNAEY